ncbi:RecF/RecN/SMC [Emericellopsis atlantica]|uniref:Structural maintenance of chromosomes protein n=1 Tax=Emericellopsis atlantica TaxID=2614577 RepID=A0A9P8CNM9_9HYPO|nr:RecF/RecN/SMC [Emericellopsis atlantica]KAG9253302.1 RecF/RecN/SMC [Emericellopsis atlantica]
MFIKQIIIQGFKSYKEQTVIEPFSSKTNVIVGRNGSGKSNFFAAIRFVLSDAYTNMSREERQGLLHEGSGSAVMSAYVEIIFDNSDGRFVHEPEEVVLRRTIGLKKDEYSVNRKVVPKQEVMNMLESAGFSRSNPYYIVPQGRVTALTNMKESERLNLLKEVAGTRVYENRRAESLKIMNETNNKREKIDELLKYIEERLSELEEEKEELRGFQDKDRERRCLEYAYHFREQALQQERLEEIESREKNNIDADEGRAELNDNKAALAELDQDMQKLQREMELLRIERAQLEEDRRDNAKALANAEMTAKDIKDSQSSRAQTRAQHAAELQSVKAEIAAKEQELAKLVPKFNKTKAKEDVVRKNLDASEAQRARLFNKQHRGAQYKNKRQRDEYLQETIEDLNNKVAEQKANKMDVDEELVRLRQAIKQGEQEAANLRERLSNWDGDTTHLAEEASQARDRVDKLNEERKMLRRENERLQSHIANADHVKRQAEEELRHTMDRDVSRGLNTLRQLRQERDLPGVYGTVAELFEVPETYRTAVEQIAGGRLFNYVVDNDVTASGLLNHLNKTRGGRITCVPLDRVRPRNVNMPRSRDAIPVLSKLTYDPKFEPAFQRLFGNTIICPNLAIGAQYSRSHGVDSITLQGDTTNKRGALSGGYVDPSKSRIKASRAANEARDEFNRLMEQSRDLVAQIEAKDQDITAAMSEATKAQHRLDQAASGHEPAQRQLRSLLDNLENQRTALDEATLRGETIERNMNAFMDERESCEAELQSEFKKNLTAAEEQQLESLSATVQELQKQWTELAKVRSELGGRKQILETDLRQNLQLRLDRLNSQAFEDSASGGSAHGLKEAEKELKRAQKAVQTVEADLRATESKYDQLATHLEEMTAQKDELEQAQAAIIGRIKHTQKAAEKALAGKGIVLAKLAESAKNIRDLGALPEEAFGKYEQMGLKQVASRLGKVKNALDQYKHVNKKAFEQYNSFTTQQTQLMNRRQELSDSQNSIEELMEHLDRKKDEAIERTFKQVSSDFAEIFEKLVPAGQGRLVIQRRTDKRAEPADESEDENRDGRSVENYIGVGIRVSFNSKSHDEQQRIQQLSGGQKSLCALCLIFALQKAESSPMVIFDEVDANLDAQYRTAVASLLVEISNGEAQTQFICTTFRPEIVHVAEKCYGVTFRNKTSSIGCVPTDEALEFVEGQAKPI